VKYGRQSREPASSALALQALLLGPILLAISVTVALWEHASREQWKLLTLFAVAGAIGGFLRSSAYALATRSFSQREFRQWKSEALFAPVLGAASGLGAYLFVDAALVSDGNVNQAGQYIVSLLAGTAALSIVGQYVERGLARSSISRSGMLGGQPSGALPLIGRFDEILDERLSEQTTVNFTGLVEVGAQSDGPVWVLSVRFMGTLDPIYLEESPPLEAKEPDWPHPPDLSSDRPAAVKVRAPVHVLGGVDRGVVPFTVAVVSASHRGLPAVLAVAALRRGSSPVAQLLVERTASSPALDEDYVAVEIGQAGATWQLLKVQLPDGTESISRP
jgi:hypothetical protein